MGREWVLVDARQGTRMDFRLAVKIGNIDERARWTAEREWIWSVAVVAASGEEDRGRGEGPVRRLGPRGNNQHGDPNLARRSLSEQ